MKRMVLAAMMMGYTLFANAQLLPGQTRVGEALRLAASGNKLLLVIPESIAGNDKLIDRAFTDKKWLAHVKDSILCLRIKKGHPDFDSIHSKFTTAFFFMAVLNADGLPVGYSTRASSLGSDYIAFCRRAGKRLPALGMFFQLEKKMQTRVLEEDELLSVMETRKAIGFTIDSLLEVFTKRVSLKKFYNNTTLRHIIRLAPAIQSPTGRLLFKDMAVFDKVFLDFSWDEQQIIGRQITDISMSIAAQSRNRAAAIAVANFARSVSMDSLPTRVFARTMLDYYGYNANGQRLVYLKEAALFIENYYMDLDDAAIIKADSDWFVSEKKMAKPSPDSLYSEEIVLIFGGNASDKISPKTQTINDLYNAAEMFYHFTNDTAYLHKAIRWVGKANRLNENRYSLALLSKLLYFDGQVTAALETGKKALQVAAPVVESYRNAATEDFRAVYKKMVSGDRVIDNKKYRGK